VEEWSFLVLEFPAFPNAYQSRSEARRDGGCEHPETPAGGRSGGEVLLGDRCADLSTPWRVEPSRGEIVLPIPGRFL